ncbi:uncharacterized protein [Littorina saxatilis]|uniref:uncharacterized protein n=1 Tax=Littorina saxatilis TaxID=31220 RepID=UPI0038B69787
MMGATSNPRKPSKISRMKRRLRSRGSLIPIAVMAAIFVALTVPMYKLYSKVHEDETQMVDSEEADLLPLYRDLYTHEEWPGVESDYSEPNQVQHTVHYLWCGQKVFGFNDYLGVLSILRVLQPLKLVFHYTHLPLLDDLWYNTWFWELKQSVPNLVLKQLTTSHACGSVDMLKTALGLLSVDGGFFVGEGVVLAKSIDHLKLLPFWFAFNDPKRDATSGVVFVNRGFNEHTLLDYVQVIMVNAPHCLSQDDYNRLENSEEEENHSLCVSLAESVYPRDIRSSDDPFAELARWLFYGRRDPIFTVHSGQVDLVPRISHYTWMSSDDPEGAKEFTFAHYISVLSALHVAGMDHVYVHGDVVPRGPWWDELGMQNVTFVSVEHPDAVFQQPVEVPSHASDVIRYNVLYKYGGVYQDTDVVWVNQVPDWLLGYPTVACPEWPSYGEWPDTLNLGVIIARRHSPFLRHVMSTYRYFRDTDWNFNAVLLPYRTYEWFPDTLYLDVFLQAICSHGVCHPAWNEIDTTTTTTDNNNTTTKNNNSCYHRHNRHYHHRHYP